MVSAQATDRPGARAAPRTDRNLPLLRPLDEIGDDQEIAGKSHPDDRLQLVGESFAIGFRRRLALLGGRALGIDARFEAGLQPGLGGGGQRLRLGLAAGRLVARQDRGARLRHEGAAPGDRQRVVERLGQVGEQRAHLGGAAKPVVGGQPAPVLLDHMRAVGDAEQRIMGLVHRGIGEIGLVGGDQRQVVGHREVDQIVLDPPLDLLAVAGELDIEPVGKGFPELLQRAARLLHLSVGEEAAERARGAGGQRDQPRCMRRDIRKRDMRIARLGFEKRPGNQRHQVVVPLLVLRQEDQRVALPFPSVARARARGALGRGSGVHRGHGEPATDDRLHSPGSGRHGEFERAEQIVGVGHRDGRHRFGDAELHKIGDLDGAFGERIGGMGPEMDVFGVRH